MENDFFSSDITLENTRVKLVPFYEDIQDELASIIYDEEITRFSGHHIKTKEDIQKYINQTMASKQSKSSYPFIVIDKMDGRIAGSTRFGHIQFANKRLEIGWTWYGKPYRGTGINKACKYELLKYAFEVMDFRRVQFSVDVENLRSQKAVLSLGAKQEGIFRHNYLNATGKSRDDIYYSIIQSEWNETKKNYFNKNEQGDIRYDTGKHEKA